MITPFDNNFHILSFDITDSIIQAGYVSLIKIPDVSTVFVDLDGCNDILVSEYEIVEVTSDNSYLYYTETIGTWVVSWFSHGEIGSSSSSSGYELTFELKDLIESGNYTTMNIKYISTT